MSRARLLRSKLLLAAAAEGNIQTVNKLLLQDVDINIRDSNGMTPLMVASDKGHLLVVMELLKKGARADLTSPGERTALHYAARKGYVDIGSALILQGNAPVDARMNPGGTALFVAAFKGFLKFIEMLFLNNAALDIQATPSGATALSAASQNGYADVVKALIQEGASLDLPCKDGGTTPLALALKNERLDVVVLLIGAKVKIDFKSKELLLSLNAITMTYSEKTTNISFDFTMKLLNCIRLFGYISENRKGVCLGYACMFMEAYLAHITISEKGVISKSKDLENFFKMLKEVVNQLPAIKMLKEKGELRESSVSPEIHEFCKGLGIYHTVGMNGKIIKASVMVGSKKLIAKGGIVQLMNFSGIYMQVELENYFNSFRRTIEKLNFTCPVVFIISSLTHAIPIVYCRDKNTWIFTHSDSPLGFLYENHIKHSDIACAVIDALSSNKQIATFQTEIFTVGDYQKETSNLISAWRSTVEWKNIHEITRKKAQLYDSDNISWLHVAAKSNDSAVVIALLAAGADFNRVCLTNVTPLFLAVQANCWVANNLIAYGAQIDARTSTYILRRGGKQKSSIADNGLFRKRARPDRAPRIPAPQAHVVGSVRVTCGR